MTPVTFLDPTAFIFKEVSVEDGASQALIAWWKDYASMRPTLFNGRLIACLSCELGHDGSATIEWYQTSYAHYLQRAASTPVADPARALFCSVALLSETGELVIGQMSETTSSPLRLQLPGGNLTLPTAGELSLAHCAADACQELREEVGVSLDVSALRLWRVKTGGDHDDVGIIFECRPALSNARIQDIFDRHHRALLSNGEAPEFDRLLFVRPACFRSGAFECVDYLRSVALALPY
jgi:hypothetical protein